MVTHPPPCAALQIWGLADPRVKVEIEAIAHEGARLTRESA